MTECPFKTHKELGLNKREWEALIKTLLLMEADMIVHVPKNHKSEDEFDSGGKPVFNMWSWSDDYKCGTVCCIGGSAEHFGKLRQNSLSEKADKLAGYWDDESEDADENLYNLFFEWGSGDPTPQQAAKVLRGYLTTGVTDWGKVRE